MTTKRAVALPVVLVAAVVGAMAAAAPRKAEAACGDCAMATAAVLKSAAVTQSLVIDTAAATNAFIAAEFATHTTAMVLALQAATAQISGNIRGTITGQGLLQEAMSNQDTQRLIQGDRVEAAKTFQYSTPLCQTATGATIATAQEAEAVPAAVRASKANAARTSGFGSPSGPASAAPNRAFEERKPLFCSASDPACRVDGERPLADRMPGAILKKGHLDDDLDRKQATWVVQNLTQPVPLPALTDAQVARSGGREAYLARGGAETMINLAKDHDHEVFVQRQEKTADASYYNQLAAQSGLPQITGGVSQEDMDRMRYRDRFTKDWFTQFATLGAEPLLREVIALQAESLKQGYRRNQLLELQNVFLGSLVSTLQVSRMETLIGKLN